MYFVFSGYNFMDNVLQKIASTFSIFLTDQQVQEETYNEVLSQMNNY